MGREAFPLTRVSRKAGFDMENFTKRNDDMALRKALGLSAHGLYLIKTQDFVALDEEQIQKRQRQGRQELRQGISLFMLLRYRYTQDSSIFDQMDITYFLTHYANRPFGEWLEGWNTERGNLGLGQLKRWKEYWGDLQLVRLHQKKKQFYLTQEALAGLEEGQVFQLLLDEDSPSYYVKGRRFIIEHPMLSGDGWRSVLLDADDERDSFAELLNAAYERLPDGVYGICPDCGWPMTRNRGGYHCCTHRHNLRGRIPEEKKLMNMYRLKRGVMRYIAIPGLLEKNIAMACRDLGIAYDLWPKMDRYDLRLTVGTEHWAIDAKDYHFAEGLCQQIDEGNFLLDGDCSRNIYVIPDAAEREHPGYCRHVERHLHDFDEYLPDGVKMQCCTLKQLRKQIREVKHHV